MSTYVIFNTNDDGLDLFIHVDLPLFQSEKKETIFSKTSHAFEDFSWLQVYLIVTFIWNCIVLDVNQK